MESAKELTLDPQFEEVFTTANEIISTKTNKYFEKLESRKLMYKNKIFEDFLRCDTLLKEIENIRIKLEQNISDDERSNLSKEKDILNGKIDSLILKLELLDRYLNDVDKDALKLILGNTQSDTSETVKANINLKKDHPAHYILSNVCRLCKELLEWQSTSYSNNCSFSDNCNSHYKYGCRSCNMRYCTRCAYPPDPNICGCDKEMKITNAPYHSCDICRASIQNDCWRCSSCDFDICLLCYPILNEQKNNLNPKEDEEKIEEKVEDKAEEKINEKSEIQEEKTVEVECEVTEEKPE